MLDPRTIMVAIPCHDGRIMSETAGALIDCGGLFAAVSMPSEISHVSLVRNLIAASFMASPFEWLVCWDNDIRASRSDLELLLQPCDVTARYHRDSVLMGDDGPYRDYDTPSADAQPCPTRIVTAQCSPGRPLDEKTGSAADVLVCAEYSAKNDNLDPIRMGMGFVRIHRSVFETLQNLRHDGGSTVEVDRDRLDVVENRLVECHPCDEHEVHDLCASVAELIKRKQDKAGLPRLYQVSYKGRMYYDYFPSGPLISQFVPNADWKGEDHGFFTLCMLAGIIPRIETRTRLTHIGRKGYHYNGPNSGGGQ